MQLILGTKNKGKIKEIRRILSDIPTLELLTFEEVPFSDVIEDGLTFLANAKKKAQQIAEETGIPTLAEDSGLEVNALGGIPGIKTARYAGSNATDQQNIEKLLDSLKSESDRSAKFRCFTVLYLNKELQCTSDGILAGKIAKEQKGSGGFGYDSIFIPEGESLTLAELADEAKNRISHRRNAIEALKSQLAIINAQSL